MEAYRLRHRTLRCLILAITVVTAPVLTVRADELAERFYAHIRYLASDELEGRGVGTRGIELAAEYIAKNFREIGLEPAGDDKTFFQSFDMTLRRTLTDDARLAFPGDTQTRKLRVDYIPFSFSSDDAFSGPVVFCGYGIEAPEHEHNDFVHVDLSGKVALMLRGEPESWADADGTTTRHAMFRNKVYNAKDRDAVAVLIVNQTPQEGESDELSAFETESEDAYGVPAFHITRAMAEAELKRGGLDDLDTLQSRLDKSEFTSAPLAHVAAEGQAVFKKNTAATRNIVGLLRGAGPLADEYVVVGAHYDHLGKRKPMMRKFKAGKLVHEEAVPQIHNGADDNASGTSGLIEIARMFAAAAPPARSILFVAFTAEESGLHGSKFLVEHSPVPLDSVVAMLNMDMIGRMESGTNEIQVFGVDCGEGFRSLVQRQAEAVGLTLKPIADPGGRSDHAAFVHEQIPSLHFFTGNHSDYHKPSDDYDKINAEGGAKVARLVYETVKSLANQKARPVYHAVKTSEPKTASGGTPTYRVVMGLAPGYADDGKPGMAVDAVNPEGPADLAGMKPGDRIIRIGGKEVANIYDYMAATRKSSPGDTVEVVVLRDGKEFNLKVTLAAAR